MKHTKISLLIILIGLFTIMGCDKGFESINTNPNEPISVPSGLLADDILASTANIIYSTFVGGDMGSCWSQQWAKVNYEEEERYIVRQGVIEENCWKGLYEDVIADSKSMEKLAKAEGEDFNHGIALTMQAYGFSLLTEMFGDIPFSEAGKGEEGNITPKYDNQESVYDGIFILLDRADSLFTSGKGSINTNTDLVYAGDVEKWQKFANSLQFRLLMRISAKKDVSAKLQNLIANRKLFASINDDAKVNYLEAQPNANPIYESVDYGARAEYKISSVMVDKLSATSDPRLAVFAQKNKNGIYRGKPAGIDLVPNNDYDYDNVSALGTLYLSPTFPGYFMTYSELMFLMAEAANKGFISTVLTEADYYNKGVEASFAMNGISDKYASFIAQSSVSYSHSTGLQKIGEQNWIALFCQGIESWTEWRRTKYPALSPAIEAVLDEIPSRYNYPAIEQSVNKDNWEAAKAAMGGDVLTTKFWWLN